MFLEEITLCNIGLFRLSHTLQLAPLDAAHPVVLIGGLNGSGKTTLLDSIQLALYGRRARLSNRGGLPYDEYLRRSVSHGVEPNEESSVTLQFRRRTEGREHSYRIRRAWKANVRDVVEQVTVFHDGAVDRVLTETWGEFVEEIIPVEIAQLFFFDGEKIEGFADLDNSTQLLSKAVHSLLGLDIVKRLDVDLLGLERRKQIVLKGDSERHQVETAQKEIALLEARRSELVQEQGERKNHVGRRQEDLRKIQEDYNKHGGALFDQRQELEAERDAVQLELRAAEGQMRLTAEGATPLLLVRSLLSEVRKQHEREGKAAEAAVVGQVLADRDEQLITMMAEQSLDSIAVAAIEQFLMADRAEREAAGEQIESFLELSSEHERELRELQGVTLPHAEREATQLLRNVNRLHAALVDLNRMLAGVPAQELVAELIKRRVEAQTALTEAERRLSETEGKLKRVVDELTQKQAQLAARLEQVVEGQFQTEDAQRIITHARRVRDTISKFRKSIVSRHTGRIAELALDSFRRLLRKESLISGLVIDAENFHLELRVQDGRVLAPERLSAGERQLLAVALLWGLARASGRPLPVVIDTPLGRLDATHRQKLVENYFPQASHQVVLLSTDKEIDKEYYAQIKPFVGRAYRLEYNDQRSASQVISGYFW